MKPLIYFLWIILSATHSFAQIPEFQRFSNRQNPQKPELMFIKYDANTNIQEAHYQGFDDKEKVKLILLERYKPDTEEARVKVKHPHTGKTFELTESWAMSGAIYDNEQTRSFEMEAIYAFKAEKIYIDYPPMVARVFYSSATSPTPQPLKSCNCEQTDGEATWICKGQMPGSGNLVTIKYEANLNKITFTSPRGTKVFRKIE
jgi:hypothetical protein